MSKFEKKFVYSKKHAQTNTEKIVLFHESPGGFYLSNSVWLFRSENLKKFKPLLCAIYF